MRSCPEATRTSPTMACAEPEEREDGLGLWRRGHERSIHCPPCDHHVLATDLRVRQAGSERPRLGPLSPLRPRSRRTMSPARSQRRRSGQTAPAAPQAPVGASGAEERGPPAGPRRRLIGSRAAGPTMSSRLRRRIVSPRPCALGPPYRPGPRSGQQPRRRCRRTPKPAPIRRRASRNSWRSCSCPSQSDRARSRLDDNPNPATQQTANARLEVMAAALPEALKPDPTAARIAPPINSQRVSQPWPSTLGNGHQGDEASPDPTQPR